MFTAEARALLSEPEATDPVGPEVVGDQRALVIIGEMRPINEFKAAIFRAAGIHAVENPGCPDGRLVGSTREPVIDALTAGTIGDQ